MKDLVRTQRKMPLTVPFSGGMILPRLFLLMAVKDIMTTDRKAETRPEAKPVKDSPGLDVQL